MKTIDKLPEFSKENIAEFDVQFSEFDKQNWYNFGLYSRKKLNQAKLYSLFVHLRQMGENATINIGASYELI